MAFYILGDTHGDPRHFYTNGKITIMKLQADDYLIVCGDFGYIFTGLEDEDVLLDELETYPYTILFVDGNHENFPKIYSYPEEMWNGGKVHRIRNNVFHLMRGQVFDIEGTTFFTFGGGYSIDKETRLFGWSWWREEMPTCKEMEEGLANLEKHNWTVDYILTHTCPKKVADTLVKRNDEHEWTLQKYLDEVMNKTTYKHWYFGHWHQDYKIAKNMTLLYRECVRIQNKTPLH